MRKAKPARRSSGIIPGFDISQLRRRAEEAHEKRALTQEELAAAYNQNAEIVEIAVRFPASIDEIVNGICEQDQRFLDSGRRLLERMLRKSATAIEAGNRPAAKAARSRNRIAGESAALAPTARTGGNADAGPRPSPVNEPVTNLFPEITKAEMYGG